MLKNVIKGLLVLSCASLLMMSCAKQNRLPAIQEMDLPQVVADEYMSQNQCHIYYQNWIDAENELDECFKRADALYENCD